ncbi:molybdate ABC transporter substrate-binding protein [Polyangium aurulentum]|uniref:molybdate ABC transporter substrate-binding protein n=1 Tax=Polyangium aurulentum TaxID=2567896 RepID=UPI00146CA33A|nr:molybdate ABC transporter substrate-binding protein [Polyangium aurulentum]UQA58903.1 molybdate ABC transporter substrate-binding protein [Polyangium aurulentum]
MHRRSLLHALAGLGLAACSKARTDAADGEVVVAAATSLRKVVPALADAFSTAHPGARVVVTYGASGEICKQVEGGAGIDLVLLAAADPVDRLIRGGHVDAASRRVVATNELVLVGRAGGPRLTFATLDVLPAGERLAIGDPGAVPAGGYAREALGKLGLWTKLEGRMVLGGNVAAVLAYVERGEAPVGIVYRTEAEGAKGIEVLDVARGEWAPRPEVVGGMVKSGRGRARAATLLDFVTSPEGQRLLVQYGFGPPPP